MKSLFMVKNREILEKFERDFLSKTSSNYLKNIEIFETLLEFAMEMGKIPYQNPMEGIEIDIKYARVINGIKRAFERNSK